MKRTLFAFALLLVSATVATAEPAKLDPQEAADGYVLLFNGENLDGWQGSVNGYEAVDGVLACIPSKGGKLMTDKEYGDFSFRFQFKLTPGANNGVGIRAPLEGDPAYTGMEIQILDHDHESYKGIKPYQCHGSIYGVVAAERGHLNPVGEWNEQEILCNGKQVTIKLNGHTIVDADIEKASTPKTLDGNDHPGLKRDKGHIGFLGHGHRVEFRNVRIKELK